MKDRFIRTNQHHTTLLLFLYLYLHMYVQCNAVAVTVAPLFFLPPSTPWGRGWGPDSYRGGASSSTTTT